ncbi:MAG: family 20 glycosylhydrolase [Clostridia bacterium]|nr:family 20 glycosylhydrolase [Clostridia bacterium]
MNTILRVASLVLVFVILFTTLPTIVSADNTAVPALGVLLDSCIPRDGSFTLTASTRLLWPDDTAPPEEVLQILQCIGSQFGALFPAVFYGGVPSLVCGRDISPAAGDILIRYGEGHTAEAYTLDVSGHAVLSASDPSGLLYGADMLMKCLLSAENLTLSGFLAEDAPDTPERTVMLDTGRKYFTAQWICNFIRQISWMGFNTLELHFSEDGGFRADFWDEACYTDAYRPENDFTWLCGSHIQSWVKDPYRTDPDAGKYLTTAELIQICETAKQYRIEIIPSFDSPAHMDYITWRFQKYSLENPACSFRYDGKTYAAADTGGCINYTGTTGYASPQWPDYTTIDIREGTVSRAFVFALYSDIADFFKAFADSGKFNIGGDEVNLNTCQDTLPRRWTYDDFPGYVNDLTALLSEKGYRVRMFNDFIGSSAYNPDGTYAFDDSIEILYWNSPFQPNTGKTNADAVHSPSFFLGSDGQDGRTLYNCIQTNCYYVLRTAPAKSSFPNMDARHPDNLYWNFYHSTEKAIYSEWTPTDFGEKGVYSEVSEPVPASALGGAYFLIWNDYAALNTETEIWNGVPDTSVTPAQFYSLFDRMYSAVIKMWNSDIADTVSFDTFAAVRDGFGWFPGYTACDTAPVLPASGTPVIPVTPAPEITDPEPSIPDEQNPGDGSSPAFRPAWTAAVIVMAVLLLSSIVFLSSALHASHRSHRRHRKRRRK